MKRSAWISGAVLVLLGSLVFAWKALVLGVPVTPVQDSSVWRVELEMDARALGNRGSIRAALPSASAGQTVFDERLVTDGLNFAVRAEFEEQRLGVWSGVFDGVRQVAHAFRVQLSPVRPPLREGAAEIPRSVASTWGGASIEFPTEEQAVARVLEALGLPQPGDPLGTARTAFGYVVDEIATTRTGSDDALLTLVAREGSPVGKSRLLVTLLRAAGIPARLVSGLRLERAGEQDPVVWTQAWLAGGWVPLLPTEGRFGQHDADRVLLRIGSARLVETTGLDADGYRYLALRERLRPEEVAALVTPPDPWLARTSLYTLPLGTQATLRVLLLLPIGALVVAIFRNLVGVPTFGTFLPLLLALALRGTGLGLGLLLVGLVIAIGVGGRLALDRLHLLLVPRLCILLSVVVLCITVLSQLGRGLENPDLFSGTLFPIVILTMLIERFSITAAEEGMRNALLRLGNASLIAIFTYPIFLIDVLEHLMFTFPELLLAVMGVLVWIGAYTGYRASELLRFRSLVRARQEAMS